MKKYNPYAELRESPYSTYGNLIGYFAVSGVAMLATGALGHRWHVEFFQHIGYTDFLLIRLASSIFRGFNITRWVVGKSS